MNISDFLSPTDAILNVRAAGKTPLLKELCARAAMALKLDAGQIAREILKREELGSTGVGNGVAIPHARLSDLRAPYGILARLQKPIDFDAIDGRLVDIVFLLLLPAAPSGESLNALAAVSRKLRDQTTAHRVREVSDAEALYRLLAVSGET